MSNRTMLEFNHDFAPLNNPINLEQWAMKLRRYLRSGDPTELPEGVTYFGMRHHSEPCPLGEPPRGWDNEKATKP